MKGKVTCSSCGWSWNKSDSSKKDMYICHECGRDNSNNMKNGGDILQAQDGIQKMSSREKRGHQLLVKETENAKKDKQELQTTGQIKTPRSIAYKSKVKPQPELKQDNRTDYERGYDERKAKLKKFNKVAVGAADVATDAMQLGNFIPLPQAQFIGKIGNIAGAAVDAYQAGVDIDQKNYGSAAFNLGSATLPSFIEGSGYKRDMYNTNPGTLANDIASLGNRSGSYIPLTTLPHAISPSTIKGINYNRGVLGALGAETYIDIPKQKNGGWLDSYAEGGTMQEHQENYNDYKVSAPEGFKGDGYSNVGRNYSPAWGGSFQGGGSVYPVNYVPQAQNGKLTFLQPTSDKLPEGYRIPYDTPSSERAMSIGGENGEPAYLIPSFKYGKELDDPMGEFRKTGEHLGGPFKTWQEADEWERTVRHPAVEKKENIMFPQEQFAMGGSIPGAVGFTYARHGAPSKGPRRNQTDVTDASAQNGKDIHGSPITAIENYDPNVDRTHYDDRTNRMMLGNDYTSWIADDNLQDKVKAHENYHAKQFDSGRSNYDIANNTDQRQWAEMQKRPQMMSTDEVWGNYYNRKREEINQDLQNIHEDHPELGFAPDELLVDKIVDREQYNNPYSMEGEASYYENTGKDFYKLQNGGEMSYYQHGLDWKPKGMENGGWLDNYQGEVIKDDKGQWAHPGKVTEIGSNNITMQGVPYDVLGISDTGDTKLMKPGKDYKFKGKKVTEFPMAKDGMRQEQKGLVNLDQLTNFTNYNKPQPGGWLNKYN